MSGPASARSFDLTGPLPEPATTTVLEASAGTGKTFALAGLVTRYVAEGRARLEDMLLITFGRAASRELRERVRDALVAASAALADPGSVPGDHHLHRHLTTGTPDELVARQRLLRDALASFDSATIATTHQFCQLVLRSLGVAGDSEAGLELKESLDDLVTEVVDDLYLARFRQERDKPAFSREEALALARNVVGNPHATLTPSDPAPGTPAAARVDFAGEVVAEIERRKRRLGILGFDDLLTRLAAALEDPAAPARQRMRDRWSIVMVDEFQDTDPVQWRVLERAFDGASTLILIGDPKQAIYAFRGGDIATYLEAAEGREIATLDTNWRSDRPLVTATHAVLAGAALGDERIVVRPVATHHAGHRLAGAPHNDPFRLRVVTRHQFGLPSGRTIAIDRLRDHIAADLAADVKALLASDATYDGRPVGAGDIAVIVEAHKDARACRDALAAAGVPAVYTGDTDVFASPAADDWLRLLEAFEQPHRSGLVRAAAVTRFFGESAASLASGGEALTDRVSTTLRAWADHARERGLAAVVEAAQVAGLSGRVLATQGGERHLTDLTHLGQLLHETAHRERWGLPALLQWLRENVAQRRGASERNRRLDSDADAVQIMTVWVSKGLQYPLVYLPFAFNRHVPEPGHVLYHDGPQRCLDIGGRRAGFAQVQALGRRESAGDDIRLTYVALTRAQSQVVAWWAPSWDEPNGGLSRLLRGRGPGGSVVPDRCEDRISDEDAVAVLRTWEGVGGPVLERSEVADAPDREPPPLRGDLGVRRFSRLVDTAWRRTSYSGLIRSAAEQVAVTSEPDAGALDDEVTDLPTPGDTPAPGADVPSPMGDLPAGADLGSLVHAVLEEADPEAGDLLAELTRVATEQLAWWPVDVSADRLAESLVPLHDTPLGPLLPGLTLRGIGQRDRLCELDFEIPLAGGDRHPAASDVRLRDVGELLRRHLPVTDALRPYAERLLEPSLGSQSLRGYLSGSIDVVLRTAGPRYVVVDYKTNRLGERDRPLSAADYAAPRLAEAMLHSDYPLQALLYSVVLHRYLRWRQPGYDPATHLGGVAYLYLRGMCGSATPELDGHPAGVFSWHPPAALVTALSDLLDGRHP